MKQTTDNSNVVTNRFDKETLRRLQIRAIRYGTNIAGAVKKIVQKELYRK